MISKEAIEHSLIRALISASAMKKEMQLKKLETMRIARLAYSIRKTTQTSTLNKLDNELLMQQYDNGSWCNGTVASVWITSYLGLRSGMTPQLQKCINFLKSLANNYCWGRFDGDMLRIPTTGLVLHLLRDTFYDIEFKSDGICAMWEDEFGCLTYKAAFFLLSLSKSDISLHNELVTRTVAWLKENQEQSGAFAPWKNHPLGSGNALWTAQVILALLHVGSPVDDETIQRAIKWLIQHQLASGIWPYHEIDEGLSWSLLALNAYLKNINE